MRVLVRNRGKIDEERVTHVEQDIHHHESKVAPVVRVFYIKVRFEELISRPNGTEVACACSVRVSKITANAGDMLLHEACASLTEGWV